MPSGDRPATESDAIRWLVGEIPDLRPILDEHIVNYEQLLPYVLFESEFLRWFIDRVRAGDQEAGRRFVVAIEPLLTTEASPPASDPVWNLAGVCFVEGLQNEPDVVDAARRWAGPNTLRAFALVR
jgi:hypothetical protein